MSEQLAEQQSSAPATVSAKRTFQQLVESEQFKSQIMAALPKTLTPERFIRVLMTATIKTPALLECTQESMFQSIFSCAAVGLEIDGRRAALVPLRNRKKQGQPLEANLWIMYQGIAELVMRSGLVSNIHADLVCDKDEFEYDRGQLTKHKINYREDRGEPYAAYSVIRMRDGTEKVEVMSAVEIERIRQASPGATADAWRLNWGEMAKKTVFKRAAKWVPLSAETRDAIEAEHETTVNVTGTGGEGAPALTEPEKAPDRPPPPPRAKKGASAIAENPQKPATMDAEIVPPKDPVTPPPAPDDKKGTEVPQSEIDAAKAKAAALRDEKDRLSQNVTEVLAKSKEQAAAANANKPRTKLAPDELAEGLVCTVKSLTGIIASVPGVAGKTGTMGVELTGDFEGTAYHMGGGTITGDEVVAKEPWKVGARVKLTLFGKSYPATQKNPAMVRVLVDKVEAVASGAAEMEI